MYPLIAALIALAIVLLMWRFLDPRREAERSETREIWERRQQQREQQRRQRRAGPPRIVAPDDDPEFLRELRHRIRKNQPAKETKDGEEEQPS